MFDGGLIILLIIVAVLAGAVAGYVLKQVFTAKKVRASESLAARIVDESKKEAETIKKEAILQAKENLLKIKADLTAKPRMSKMTSRRWSGASGPRKKTSTSVSIPFLRRRPALKVVKKALARKSTRWMKSTGVLTR